MASSRAAVERPLQDALTKKMPRWESNDSGEDKEDKEDKEDTEDENDEKKKVSRK